MRVVCHFERQTEVVSQERKRLRHTGTHREDSQVERGVCVCSLNYFNTIHLETGCLDREENISRKIADYIPEMYTQLVSY